MNIEQHMTQIFISYSRKDIAFARRLAGDLEKAGYVVWWDITDLRGGDDWVRVIPEAIETSDFFIVVLSPHSTASEWVRKEYTQALSLRKRVIPLMLETTAVPFALNTINYLDFTSPAAYADNLNALLLALGYTGDLPVAPAATWPLTLRSLAIPIIVSAVILLILGGFYVFSPPATSTPTATVTASLIPHRSPQLHADEHSAAQLHFHCQSQCHSHTDRHLHDHRDLHPAADLYSLCDPHTYVSENNLLRQLTVCQYHQCALGTRHQLCPHGRSTAGGHVPGLPRSERGRDLAADRARPDRPGSAPV